MSLKSKLIEISQYSFDFSDKRTDRDLPSYLL